MAPNLWKKYIAVFPETPESVAEEILAAALSGEDSCGWEQYRSGEELAWAVYFEADNTPADFPRLVAATAEAFGLVRYRVDGPTDVLRENWNLNWRQFFQPVEIGNRFIVVPSWEKQKFPESGTAGRTPIYLEPGMAFGTGTHATTQLCMELSEDVLRPGAKVLDLGTGSGILAIAAIKMGAASCVAVDIDPEVHENLLENMRINSVPDDAILPRIQPLDAVPESGFDFAFCNMLSLEFLPLLQALIDRVQTGGQIAFSGMLTSEQDEMLNVLAHHGLRVEDTKTKDEWLALRAKK
jgi:ribosomal protein L11 methyltransferase